MCRKTIRIFGKIAEYLSSKPTSLPSSISPWLASPSLLHCYNLPPMPRLLRPCFAWIALSLMILGNLLPMSSVTAASLTEQADICSSSNTSGQQPALPAHGHCSYCTMCQALVLDVHSSEPIPYRANLSYYVARATIQSVIVAQRYLDPWARAPPG